MYKIAKFFGLIKTETKKNPKKPNFFTKLREKRKLGKSEGDKKPKIKWKLFVVLGVVITLISLIVYFAAFFNKPTFVEVSGIEKNEKNQIVLITGKDNTKKILDDKSQPYSYFVEEKQSTYEVYSKTTSGSVIYYNIEKGQDGPSTWFNAGNVKLVKETTPESAKNGLSLQVYLLNQNGTANVDASTKAAAENFFNYLSTATNIGFTKPRPVIVYLLPFLQIFIQVAIILFIFRLITRSAMGAGAGQDSIFGIGKSLAKTHKSKITFKDVAGIEEEKAELEEVVDYLKDPSKYVAMGARTPRGVILYGPPGTGKTLLAKAVSGEAGVPFFEASGASFDDMFVGVGAKRVRDLFNQAKKAAPCIIFIDEIDAVAGKRGNTIVSGGSGVADQTINQLLSEMDGFNTGNGIIVVAATNRLDSLDEAILRPGRFDRHIQVTLPSIKERVEILKLHARNKNLSSKVNLENVARKTPGFSGAQLENVLNEATLLAVRDNKTVISETEVDEAIDRVIAGPAKKSRVTTPEERKQIAYHEGGHALSGLYAKGGEIVEKITIIPRGQAAGYMLSAPEKQELLLKRKSDLLAMVTTLLSGRASEEIIYGADNVSSGASNDFYKATNIVKAMVTQLGMSSLGLAQLVPSEGPQNPYSKNYSEATALAIDNEINKILNEQYKQAKDLIKEHRAELDLIVECLLLLETIVKPQIDYIHKYKKLPPEALEAKQKQEKILEKAESKKPAKTKKKSSDDEPSEEDLSNQDVDLSLFE